MTPRSDIGPGALRRASALVVDTDARRRAQLVSDLGRHVGLVEGAGNAPRAESLMDRCHFDCAVLDFSGGDGAVAEWLSELRRRGNGIPVVICCDPEDARKAIALMRFGIAEILMRPFEVTSLVAVVQRARDSQPVAAPAAPRGGRSGGDIDALLIGDSAAMVELRGSIERVAPLPAAVLLEGEPGTGKELVARLLHRQSGRRGSLVRLDCGAVAPEQMDSELFGHAKGALTSGHPIREGLFVAARGGTLFLDEVAALPLAVQAKLLRSIEEAAIRPVGSDHEIKVDVRILAATRHDLGELVRKGRFRDDLYYRLKAIHLSLPPLRYRREDVEALAVFFMETLARDLGMAPIALAGTDMERMKRYAWPGNVQELKAFVERTLLMGAVSLEGMAEGASDPGYGAVGYPAEWTLEEVKQHHMLKVLEQCHGNRSEAARRLAISRKTLERRLGKRRRGSGKR